MQGLGDVVDALVRLLESLWSLLAGLFAEVMNSDVSGAVAFLALGVLLVVAGRVANVIAVGIGGALVLLSLVRLVSLLLGAPQ